MKLPKAIKLVLLIAGIVVMITLIAAYRSAKWMLGTLQPAHAFTSGTTSPTVPPTVVPGAVNAGVTARGEGTPAAPLKNAMSRAFDSGSLPAPLAITEPDPDEAALALAKKIAAQDQNSTAALITALQMSGFSVRAKNGDLLPNPTTTSQGMALDAWQVAAMAKLYGQHWHMSAADLTTVVQKLLPGLGKAPVSDMLLSGIAQSAQGPQPLRFWSRVIIDLGLVSANHYEISASNPDPASLQLDAIQVALRHCPLQIPSCMTLMAACPRLTRRWLRA